MQPMPMSSASRCGCSFPARRWGCDDEMRRIVDDLDGRRRALFEEAKMKIEALAKSESLLTEDERRELARWRNLARFQPPVIDYLKARY